MCAFALSRGTCFGIVTDPVQLHDEFWPSFLAFTSGAHKGGNIRPLEPHKSSRYVVNEKVVLLCPFSQHRVSRTLFFCLRISRATAFNAHVIYVVVFPWRCLCVLCCMFVCCIYVCIYIYIYIIYIYNIYMHACTCTCTTARR